MIDIRDKVFGVLLNLDKNQQYEYINNLRPEWFENNFHTSILKGVQAIKNENRYIDTTSIIKWLREANLLEKDFLIKITNLVAQAELTDILSKNSILNQCAYEYSLKKVGLMVNNVAIEINKDQPSQTRILEELEKVKNLFTENTKKEVSNEESIDYILEKHLQAKQGISIGLELGWNSLKKEVVLEKDDVMIVGGRPAMGKTAWAISLMKNICFDQNKVMVFFSLEMAHDRIMRRLISNITKVDSNKIKYGTCEDHEIKKIINFKANPLLKNIIIFDGSHTTKDIENKIQSVKNRGLEIDVFVVDYIQKILPEKSDSRYLEVTRISNDIKRIVMAHRIPTICLAQLSRDAGKTGKRPTLPDLKESGEIEQDASIVAFLHRPEYYGVTEDENGNSLQGVGEFLVAKNRDGAIGVHTMDVKLETSEWNDLTERLEEIRTEPKFANFVNNDLPF